MYLCVGLYKEFSCKENNPMVIYVLQTNFEIKLL